jgi:hypothetical protein
VKVVFSLITFALFTGCVAFYAYWRGVAAGERHVRWLSQELLRAERIAEQMKDAAMDAELEALLRTAK